MDIAIATDQTQWDNFLSSQQFRPFLQSWTMGEVYRECGEPPIRLELRDGNDVKGICQAIVVPARRGKHLAIPYGPIGHWSLATGHLVDTLKELALKHNCAFIRLSPFSPKEHTEAIPGTKPSPLHLLAEHIWYIPLVEKDLWQMALGSEARARGANGKRQMANREETKKRRNEETILKEMRKNTRNLIRRAEREGVTIERSQDPMGDLETFITLHEETRQRHGFTPYTNAFFRAQVKHFAPRNECTLYKALYNDTVIACSVHMHAFGETSYHHGASTHAYSKIPASYLLQWTAIQDAIKREDHVYNFWGIAPLTSAGNGKHPFEGVTTFKTGFGGELLELAHCMDIPVSSKYILTRTIETCRKWKRGF